MILGMRYSSPFMISLSHNRNLVYNDNNKQDDTRLKTSTVTYPGPIIILPTLRQCPLLGSQTQTKTKETSRKFPMTRDLYELFRIQPLESCKRSCFYSESIIVFCFESTE
jgi:hypothetical protein